MSSVTSIRVNESVVGFLAARKLPFSATLALLDCPHSYEASNNLVVTSYAECGGSYLVNFHYKKDLHEDPTVGHVRGWVVLYEKDAKPRLVCRGMRVPKILNGGDLDPVGESIVRVVCRNGDTRLRIFSALGRTWISSHRSLDCLNDRWIENSVTFGELLATANLTGHFDQVSRGKVVSFVVPSSGAVDSSDGLLIWDPQTWTAVSYSTEVPETYLNVTFYNQSTGECWTRLSAKKFEECTLRGNSGSLFESFEASLRANEDFHHLSTAERQRYLAARSNFFGMAHHYYTRRYVKGEFVQTNAHLHRFLKFLQECENGKPLTVEQVEQISLDYNTADFSKLVTHSRSFLKS